MASGIKTDKQTGTACTGSIGRRNGGAGDATVGDGDAFGSATVADQADHTAGIVGIR